MKDKKKLLIIVLSIVVAVALVTVGLVVGLGSKPGDDSSSVDSSDSSSGGQTETFINGKFYLASGDGSTVIELELKNDGTYALKFNSKTESGAYTLDGANVQLKVEGGKYNATYNGDTVVLTYDGGRYNLVKDVMYTVTFKNAEGFMPDGAQVRNQQKLVLSGKPEKEGYNFVAWYTDEACTKLFSWNTPITGDIALYAKFVSLADEEYSVSYYNQDGALRGTGTTVGKAVTGLLSGEGENFIGWWMSDSEKISELSREVVEGTVLNADTKLYAVYKENKKLTVSVNGNALSWSDTGNENTNYTVTVDSYANTISGKTSATFAEISAELAKELALGEHTVTVSGSFQSAEGRITYEGKAVFYVKRLAKPSNIKVENSVLTFGAVENATEYKLTIDFGDKTEEKTLTEPVYDLSEYTMPENNVKFTVCAVGDGYYPSVDGIFEYETEKLDSVGTLAPDEAANVRKVTWNAVDNATEYEVTVTMGDKTETYTVTKPEFDVKAYDVYGTFTLSVVAKAGGYCPSAAVTATFTRTDLPQPKNVLYAYDGITENISWNAVDGAIGYGLKVIGKDKNGNAVGTEHVFDSEVGKNTRFNVMGRIDDLDAADYVYFIVYAKDETGKDSEPVEYKVFGHKTAEELGADDFTYSDGTLSWTPVRKVREYELTLPDGTHTVSGTSYNDIALDSTRTSVRVAYTSGNGSMTAGYEVLAYAISFVKDQSTGLVDIVYAAEGDTIDLPSGKNAPTMPGYEFGGWVNAETGAAYGATLTVKNALTINAKWNNARYNLTFDVGGGKAFPDGQNSVSVTYLTSDIYLPSGKTGKLPVPEVGDDTSKLFFGWYTAPGGAADKRFADQYGNVTTTYKYTFDSVLYAYWVTAFEFEPNKTGVDENGFSTVESYKVKKGPDIDLFDKVEVTIPATYNGKPVDYIASNAFSQCRFSRINIPQTVYTIEVLTSDVGSAFSGCSYLEHVEVYQVEGMLAQNIRYFSDSGVLYFENEDRVTEHNKTEVAFVPRKLEGTIVIPDSVEIIPGYIMGSNSDGGIYNSHSFTGVVIPWSVKEIHENAFLSSTKLLTVVFDETPVGEKAQPLNISSLAFAKCTSLAELSLPSRLEKFEASIIDGCTKLLAVYIGNGNANYSTKDGVVFNKDQTELLYFPRGIAYDESVDGSGEYTIPDGVTKIASNAFAGSQLRKVTIASTVTEIAPYAFSGVDDGKSLSGTLEGFFKGAACTKLEEVVFEQGNSPLSIGEGAFFVPSGTNVMTSITLPRNLYKLGEFAFTARTKLESVTFETDERYLGGNAIDYAVTAFSTNATANLTPYVKRVKLTQTVPVIDNLAGMIGNSNLAIIDVEGNPNYKFDDEVLYDNEMTKILYFLEARTGPYVVPETVTRIEEGTFRAKKYLTEITIHSGVEYIGDEAFRNCSGLVKVTINDSKAGEVVTELNLGNDVFYGCGKLEEIELPTRTRTIGSGLFKSVKTLTEVVIPEGVTELGDEAFGMATDYSYNEGLRKVTLPSTLEKFGTYEIVNGEYSLVSLNAFFNCSALEEIVVGEGNQNFEASDGVLYATVFDPDFGCKVKQLVVCVAGSGGDNGKVTVVENVTKVWANAFRNNAKVKEIIFEASNEETMPESMKGKFKLEIGENAFLGCKLLEKIELPVGLTEILSDTFKNCETLKEVVVPYTVTTISGGYYKTSLGKKYGAFNNCKSLEKITFQETPEGKTPVPLEITDGNYSRDYYGSEYIYNAFMSCPALTSIVFPERMTYLGEVTFRKSNIKTVVLPSTLKSVGYGAFYGTKQLESVTFRTNAEGKSELTAIAPYMFSSSNIKSIDIPEGVTAIDCYAFSLCYELTSVKLPSTLTIIGRKANSGCLSGTTNPSQSTGYAFNGDKALKNLVFEGESQLETIEEYSFSNVGVTKMTLPATIKKVGDYAFSAAKIEELAFEVKAPKSGEAEISALESVGKNAFQNSTLKKVSFPETAVKELTLGENLFRGCNGLENVYLPSTVASIDGVFNDCKADFELKISDNNKNIKLHSEDTALVVTEVKSTDDEGNEVKRYAVLFAYKQIMAPGGGFTEYKLPSDVFEIGKNAFAYQNSITKVIIPSGVIAIGEGAFHDCLFLQEVEFEYTDNKNQLAQLGAKGNSLGVFENCYSLSKVVLPNNGINADNDDKSLIYQKTFSKCLSLEKVGVTPAFDEIANLDGGVYLPNNLVTLGENPTYTSSSVYGVFANCFNLKEVTLPAGLKSLGNTVFGYCYALDTVTYVGAPEGEGNALSDNIEEIGTGLFTYTTSLKSIKLPKNNKIERLPIFMFEYGGLETITIPSTIKFVGNGTASATTAAGAGRVFKNCYNLTEVKFEKDENDKVLNNVQLFGQNTFENTAITEMDLSSAISLGTKLFLDCTKLETVTLGDKLVQLPNYMFSGCTSFTGVKMNEDGTVAYDEKGNYQYTLELPESLIHMGQYTFMNSGIIAIKIPKNVTALTSSYAYASKAATYGNYNAISETFNGCAALESVIFQGKVTHIGKNAFNLCTSLEEVLAPDSEGNYTADGFFGGLMFVGDTAFKGTAIKRVTLNSAERFGIEVFMDSAVEEVYISNGMRYNGGKTGGWGARMFKNCVNLKGVKCDENGNPVLNEDGSYTYTLVLPDNEYYFGSNTFENTGLKVVKFGKGVTTFGSSATDIKTYSGSMSTFLNCVDLEKVIFEGDIKQIAGSVFKGCTKLSTVVGMEATIEYIGSSAFADTAIETLNFEADVELGASAFESCDDLTSVHFADTQTKALGAKAFYQCGKLATFNLPDGIANIGANCFNGTAYSGETLTLPKKLKTLGNGAFWGLDVKFAMADDSTDMKVVNGALFSKDGKTLYNVPEGFAGRVDLNGVTKINAYAFAHVNGITEITMPSGNVELDRYAFAYSRIPDGFDLTELLGKLGTLPSYAFQYAQGIGDLVIPEGFKLNPDLYSGVATGCSTFVFNGSDITSVVIPSSMAIVPNDTFLDCTKLTSVTFGAGVEEIRFRVFKNTALTEVFIPKTINYIHGNSFENCVNLEKVEFEEGTERIGAVNKFTVHSNAFEQDITYNGISASSATGGHVMFNGCSIETLVLPSTLKEIGATAFSNNKINKLEIPDGVTDIGKWAFVNNSITGELIIPASCVTIGDYAFDNNNITSLKFAKDEEGVSALTTIGAYAFNGNMLGGKLEIPENVNTIGKYAFAGKERTESLDEDGNGTGEYDYTGCSTVTEVVLPSMYISMEEGTFANYYSLAKINLDRIQKIYPLSLVYAGILNDKGLELTFGALTYVGVTVHTINTGTGEVTGLGNGPLGYANVAKITFLTEESVQGKLLHSFTTIPEFVFPEGLTALPNYFYAYTLATEITVPAFVETMGTDMFNLNVYVKKITFENGSKLTEIGSYAFANCPNLSSLTLPDSLETIGTWAFRADLSLKTVVLPRGTSIGSYATAFWKADQTFCVRAPKALAYGYLAYDFNFTASKVLSEANVVFGYNG